MDSNNPRIFFSYSWADRAAADEIDKDFTRLGIKLTRDLRDLNYGRKIEEFTQTIMDHDFMLTLLSDDFLRSENCMHEVAVLLGSLSLKVGILPIILDNAKHILKLEGRTYYYGHWKKEYDKAVADNKEYGNQDSLNQLKKISSIHNCIDSFLTLVTGKITQTLSGMRQDNYRQLLNSIGFNHNLLADRVGQICAIKDASEKLQAIREFQSTIAGTVSGDFFRALFSRELGDFVRAKNLYLEFVDRYANQYGKLVGVAHYNLAVIETYDIHDYQKAAFHYREAVRLNPDRAEFHYYFGILLGTYLKDYSGARSQLEDAVRLKPDDSLAHGELVLLLQTHFKDPNAVRRHLQEYIRIKPGESTAHYELARLLKYQFKDIQGAWYYYEQAILHDPDYGDAQLALALLLFTDIQNYPKAAMHFEQVVRINPLHALSHSNLGWIYYYKFSDKKKAKPYLEKALRLDPTDKIARDTLTLINKRTFF